ncbi:MAG: putative membrane protein [Myxococcota bacterium]
MPNDTALSFSTATDTVLHSWLDRVKANVGALVGAAVVWLAATFAGVFAILFVPWLVAGPGIAILGSVYGDSEPPAWALLGVIVPSGLLYLAAFGVVLLGFVPAMQGSLHRAFDAAGRGEPIPWSAPVASLRTNLGPVMRTNAAVVGLTLVGSLFFILPGMLVGLVTLFAIPAAALDGLGARDAIGRAMGHARENPGFHGGVILGYFIIALACGFIPLLGSGLGAVLSLGWICACYRHCFPAD